MKKLGLWIAVAALLVNGPRLVQIYLAVDGLALPQPWDGLLLGGTGVATGVVLTGGGMYLAHALAEPSRRRGFVATTSLAGAWIALLGACVVLISPALVAGIRATDLVAVLDTDTSQWTWAIVAVLAVELLAGATMVAHATIDEGVPERELPERSTPVSDAFVGIANAVAGRIAAHAERPPDGYTERTIERPTERQPEHPMLSEHERPANGSDDLSKADALDRLLSFVSDNPDATYREIGDAIGRSKSTVSDYLSELESREVIHRNGDGIQIV